ncbi:MAG: hypothetical protein ACI8W8_004790 [Rhodothermales bacterium]|jgi:hypothetical protein
MNARNQIFAVACVMITALLSGCASTSPFREPITISVEPQVQQIELGGGSLFFRAGCALEGAIAEPRSRIGDKIIVGTLNSVAGADPCAGVLALIPIIYVGIPTALAERGATFAGNLRSLENYGRSTLAEAQLAEAAKQADVAAMFGEHCPVSKIGDLRVIVRSVKTDARRTSGADLTITVEVVRPKFDGKERVLRKYVHEAFYQAEHPDLVPKRRTPTRAIQAGIAEIATEIKADFNIASHFVLAEAGQ